MSKYISIGKVLNFHGIKGEAKIGYSKNREEQLKSLKKVVIDAKEYDIESIRFHKNLAIVKFKGIDSINDILPLKGKFISIAEADVKTSLAEDEYLITDLEGLDVYDSLGNYVGSIVSVGENRAASLLGIKASDDKVHLVPFVRALVPVVDLKENRVVINNIEGLIE